MNERLARMHEQNVFDHNKSKANSSKGIAELLHKYVEIHGDFTESDFFETDDTTDHIKIETGEVEKPDYIHPSGFKVLFRKRTVVGMDGIERIPENISYRILEFLVDHKDTHIPNEKIYRHVWGDDYDPSTRTLSVHLSRIRKLIYGEKYSRSQSRKLDIIYTPTGSNGVILHHSTSDSTTK